MTILTQVEKSHEKYKKIRRQVTKLVSMGVCYSLTGPKCTEKIRLAKGAPRHVSKAYA